MSPWRAWIVSAVALGASVVVSLACVAPPKSAVAPSSSEVRRFPAPTYSAAPVASSPLASAILSSVPSADPPPVDSASPPVSEDGKTAVEVASRLPEVKRYCQSLERAAQPSHCVMWSEDEAAPTTKCAATDSPTDDCLWPVYLGESQPTHTVRYMTAWVNTTSRTVMAVSDWACGRMSLVVWRKWRAKAARPGKVPDCPEEAL